VSLQAFRAVVKASHDKGRFSHAELRVLVVLADHHNGTTGQCNPGYKRLAAETGLAKSYVVSIVQALEERGELLRDDPSSKGGAGNSHNITLTLRKGRPRATLSRAEKGRHANPLSEEADRA